MARTIVCPHCQMKGNLPESSKASRIRCPKCGQAFTPAASSVSATENSKVSKKTSSSGVSTSGRSGLPKGSVAVAEPVVALAEPIAAAESWRPATNSQSKRKANPFVLAAVAGLSLLGVFMLVVMVMVFIEDDKELLLAEREKPEQRTETRVTFNHEIPVEVEEVHPSSSITSHIEPTDSKPASAQVAELKPPAQPTVLDPQEITRRLKDATVYIKNTVNGKTLSTGAGFVIETQGESVWLVTTRGVAVLDMSEVPESVAPAGSRPELEVVFRSGEGTSREQTLPAALIAADMTDEQNTGLAFLEVKGVHEAPVPLSVQDPIAPSEGLSYLAAGFPVGSRGGGSEVSRANPPAKISGGRVAALRRDESGELNQILVEGSLQPGGSGGPILEERTGKLLGVAVVEVGSVDTTGFVLPAEELRRSFNGRVGPVALKLKESSKGTAELQIKAQVLDPKGNIKGVAVHVVPAKGNPAPNPSPDGSWPSVTKSKETELTHDATNAIATGSLKVALNGEGPDSRKVWVQTAYKDSKGQYVYGKPQEVMLPEKPGKIRPPGQLERMLREVRRKSINLLGPLLENSKDCVLTKDEPTLKIRIDIPGKLYTLAPELANKKNVPIHNAPITLTEVEGDFAAFVEVNGGLDPGTTAPKDPKGGRIPFTVQSQGLILYQDKDNFLRLERDQIVFPKTLSGSSRLIIEFVHKGRQAFTPIYREVPDQRTVLALLKRNGRIRCLYSQDEGKNLIAFEEFAAELPEKLGVGLSASNISTKPFSAEFENFAILNDASKLEQEFGD